MQNVNFGYGNNPYGAVPEALKETRLSLKDIMADYMATKVHESNLNLALAKANTETELVRSGAERDKLANLRELTRIGIDSDVATERARANQASEALTATGQENQVAMHQATLDQQGRLIPSQIAENTARAGVAGAQSQAIRHGLQTQTLSTWAQGAGIEPEILTAMGFSNLNATYTRDDADKLLNQYRGYIPHMGVAVANEKRKAIEKALPTAKPEDVPALEQQYKRALAQGVLYGKMTKVGDWTSKDDSALVAKLIAGGQSAEEAAKSVQTVRAGLKETHDAGDYLNSAPDAFDVLRKKIGVDPFYNERIEEAAKIIQGAAPEKLQQAITAGYVQRIKQGNYKDAYDYMRGHAYQLQQKKQSSGNLNRIANEADQYSFTGD